MMRTVPLTGTDLTVPILGFGCSSLMSLPAPQDRGAILQTAFEEGVRHFDVARYYGHGEAEGVLGDFIRGRRSHVTVTTKFGILPPVPTPVFRPALGMARRLAAASPLLRNCLRASSRRMTKDGAFSIGEARKSLDTSLQQLRTDYIDILLLHECRLNDVGSDDLLCFLEGCVESGKIRCFGVGTDIDTIVELSRAGSKFSRIVQFENSAVRQNIDLLPGNPAQATITHRSLGESFQRLCHALQSKPGAAERLSRELDVDCRNHEVLGHLMLNYAVHANPGGPVLFSSRSPKRIAGNVRAVSEARFSAQQMERFVRVAGELLRSAYS